MSGGLELLYFVERLWSLVAGLVVLLLHFALPVPFRRFVDALWYHFCFLTCETSMYFLVEGVLELAGVNKAANDQQEQETPPVSHSQIHP